MFQNKIHICCYLFADRDLNGSMLLMIFDIQDKFQPDPVKVNH